MTVQSLGAAHPCRSGWVEPTLAHVPHRSRLRPILVWAIITVGAVCDAAVLAPAVVRALQIDRTQAWVVGVAVTAVATAVAGSAGWLWRGENGNHPGRYRGLVVPVLLLVGWFVLGVVICWLRLDVASLATSAGFDGAVVQGSSDREIVAAAVFLSLYLLTGGLAAADIYHQRNDAFSTLRTLIKERCKVESSRATLESRNVRLVENYAARRGALDNLDSQRRIELQGNAALADRLKQISRLEQAIGLGNPIVTGVTSAAHPDNPAPFREISHDERE